MASSTTLGAASTDSEPTDQGHHEDDASSGPGIIVFKRRQRWMTKMRELMDVLLVGSLDPTVYDKTNDRVGNPRSTKGKQLSSIEVDPDADSQYRAGTSFDSSPPAAPNNRGGFSFRTFKRCLTMKGYALLVTCIELTGLLYLMTTSMVIYTRDPMWSWFFQPFVAPLWLRHPTALFASMCSFCIAGFVVVVCLLQALDNGRRAPWLMIPHLLLQMLTIFATLMFSLIAVVLLMTKGTFAARILELAGSSLGNGVVGVGNIVFGLEHRHAAAMTADNILMGAGITPVSAIGGGLRSNVTQAPSAPTTVASSVVRYNVIGAIWEAFNYEIATIVAVIVFGTVCVSEIFAWLLVRRLYASRVLRTHQRKENSNGKVHSRRRYYSGDTPV